jgi:hypothetical protein
MSGSWSDSSVHRQANEISILKPKASASLDCCARSERRRSDAIVRSPTIEKATQKRDQTLRVAANYTDGRGVHIDISPLVEPAIGYEACHATRPAR